MDPANQPTKQPVVYDPAASAYFFVKTTPLEISNHPVVYDPAAGPIFAPAPKDAFWNFHTHTVSNAVAGIFVLNKHSPEVSSGFW